MITTNITIKSLAAWIDNLKELAKNDTEHVVHWFGQTAGEPFSIVGGWQKMFSKDDLFNNSELFCCSKSQPEYAMCVKIAKNEGLYAYVDFEVMNMPYTKGGEVDNTCIPLEWDDDPEMVAEFFLHEWERIMCEHDNEV